MARYKNYNDGQHYFDIIDLENDLPADNRARIIREIISTIDVSSFDKNYNNDEGGAKAKHIRMMLGNTTSCLCALYNWITEHCEIF